MSTWCPVTQRRLAACPKGRGAAPSNEPQIIHALGDPPKKGVLQKKHKQRSHVGPDSSTPVYSWRGVLGFSGGSDHFWRGRHPDINELRLIDLGSTLTHVHPFGPSCPKLSEPGARWMRCEPAYQCATCTAPSERFSQPKIQNIRNSLPRVGKKKRLTAQSCISLALAFVFF